MKLTKRLFVALFLTSLTLILNSIIIPNVASAGELKATDITISWDDNSLYEPPSAASGNCTSYAFNYTMTNRVLLAYIYIKNQYGDKLGSSIISSVTSASSGKVSVQLCPSNDLTGSKVELEVLGRSGAPNELISKPIVFISRTSPTVTPTPAASVAAKPTPAPTPAPTVTVTATPAPGPTVFVKNPTDETLFALVVSQKSQINSLNAKLKKICSAKPKPKGC
jgi:cell division septation protein DedD